MRALKERFKRTVRHPAVARAGAWLVAQYLKFALGTTRWTIEGAEGIDAVLADGRAVAAFWHETLPLMPALFRQARRRHPDLRATALASRNHDGRLLGDIMRALGVAVVHGSSSKGGAAGQLALIAAIEAGGMAIITPDGPRGPRRKAAAGVAQLAALAGVPVLPCGAALHRGRRLGSWDRMLLPRPFGRGVLVCGAPIAVPREGWDAGLPAIEAALAAAMDRAEALSGAEAGAA